VRHDLLRPQRQRRRFARGEGQRLVDCVPPSVAASAWMVTRATLFSGDCAVSVTPPVCVWKRSRQLASDAPKRLRMMRA
jgi:hypothetical protein